mmetsp:Transcript_18974/g.32665  ORF Transcript_18974/g.32665 Transcript_18974/m.32665 type:complete len:86 (+) Transcript_18974:753-1010(+)
MRPEMTSACNETVYASPASRQTAERIIHLADGTTDATATAMATGAGHEHLITIAIPFHLIQEIFRTTELPGLCSLPFSLFDILYP